MAELTGVQEIKEEAGGAAAKNRIIHMLADLYAGKGINIEQVMDEYKVSKRSIQRDFKDIREFLQEDDITGERTLEYDEANKLYKAVPPLMTYLSEKEVYIIIKMLMECRGLNKAELDLITTKLIRSCLATDAEQVHFKNIINKEKVAYAAPRHGKALIDNVWEIQEYIEKRSTLEILYSRVDGSVVKRCIVPVGLVFSEFYFYMIAFMVETDEQRKKSGHDEFWPIVYRVDRIVDKKVLKDSGFRIPYEKMFSEGNFRNHIQFMYTGSLHRLKFYCPNYSVEAVLDRLPTAQVVSHDEKRTLIKAEVFGGQGLDMWIKSQGDKIEVVSNQEVK